MKNLKNLIVILGVILALFFGYKYMTGGDGASQAGGQQSERGQAGQGGGRPGGGGSRAVSVVVGEVEIEPYSEVFQAIGTISSKSRAQVIAESSGFVTATYLDANSYVEKGDPLVVLEGEEAKLALQTAQTRLNQAQAIVTRYEGLKNTVSKAQLEQAKTDLLVARDAVETAQLDLLRRTIVAPITGPLGLSSIEVGSYLNAGTEIVTMNNLDDLLVKFALSDRTQDFIKVGTPIEIRLPTRVGTVFHAEISGIDNEIDATTRQIAMQADLKDTSATILPGTVVNISVTHEGEALPKVPALAVSWSREGASVWLSKENKAVQVPIEIAHRSGDNLWVRGELSQGDLIVVEGAQKVREGGDLQYEGSDAEAAQKEGAPKDGEPKGGEKPTERAGSSDDK